MGNARSVIKRLRFPLDIMLLCVRWYVAYALSLRNLEEMMQERGVFVDHSTIHRWIIKLVPVLEEAFRKRKRKRGIGAVGKSWRLDETSIKIRGEDRYWYRAVDKQGNTVDFLLTAKRDRRAAQRFFTRAVKNNRLPKIVNIDKSGANNAGIKDYNRKHRTKVVTMQIPQQHCRAGPSRGQAHHTPDTRLQGLSLCANHSGWRRAYAHDPQRANARRRERSVRSSTILHAG